MIDTSPAPTASRRRAPASARSEQRVRGILRAGREVFAERGFERATTTEIAQRAGISEATVFTYFHGKRELCTQVLQDWYDEIIQTMQEAVPVQAPAREQLRQFLRLHLHLFLVEGTGLCALVLSEGRMRGQELGDSVTPLQRRYTAPLMDLLARGQAQGEIRTDLPLRLLRAMVLGPVEHVLWEAIMTGRPVASEPVAEDLLKLLWPALQTPEVELRTLRRLRDDVDAALARAEGGTPGLRGSP